MSSRPGLVHTGDLGGRFRGQPTDLARVLAAAGLEPAGEARLQLEPPPVLVVVEGPEWSQRVLERAAWLAQAEHVLLVLEPFAADGDTYHHRPAITDWPLDRLPTRVEVFDWSELGIALAHARELAARYPARAAVPPAPPPVRHAPGPAFELVGCRPDDLEAALAAGLTPDARWRGVSLHAPPPRLELARDPAGLVGHDPHVPLAWSGFRQRVTWHHRGRHGLGPAITGALEYPAGSIDRYLYGITDNQLRRVELARDLSAVATLHRFDVLVARQLPFGWRAAGPFDVLDDRTDAGRAAYFVHTGELTTELEEEDAREAAPPFSLGATSEAHHAVGLERPVIRAAGATLDDGRFERLPVFPGYGVFDARHQLRRRVDGQLLGGAAGLAVVWRDGALVREDLAGGPPEPLPAIDGEPRHAVPVPGSVNVVVLFTRGTEWFARLV